MPPGELALLHGLACEPDVGGVFRRAAIGMAALLGADGAALMMREAPNRLRYEFLYGLPFDREHLAGRTFSDEKGAAGAALRANAPLFVPDYPDSPQAMPECVAMGLGACLCVPVRSEGKVMAVLAVSWCSVQPDLPGAAHLYLLEVMADFIGAALRRARMERELRVATTHDSLTAAPNRALFFDRLEHAMAVAERESRLIAILAIDIDNFKALNGRLGSVAGDAVLIEARKRIAAILRRSDTVARIGDDEFALVIENVACMSYIEMVALRVRDSLQFAWGSGGGSVNVSASVGMTVYPLDSGDARELLHHADTAMREARRRGGGMLLCYADDFVHESLRHDAIVWEFARGIDEGEMRLFFQPIVDMETGEMVSVEALLRWDHPTQGLLAPASFMAALEHSHNSAKLDRWVLERAVGVLADWHARGLDWTLHVNLTLSSVANPRFTDLLEQILTQHAHVESSSLCLELVEWSAIRDAEAASRLIRDCKEIGVSVVLDDFGTGYASLQHLRLLPIDHIKIDRSFVGELMTSEADRVLVGSIISAARAFGIDVIAEGVELDAQRAFLVASGCRKAQGYLFAKAMPEAELMAKFGPGS